MLPLFIGGHPAVDFLNTSLSPGGEAVELIGDGKSLAAWLGASDLVEPAESLQLARRLGAAELDDAAARARRFREWTRGWLAKWQAQPGRDHAAELRHLNGLLASLPARWELAPTARGVGLVERYRITTADELLGLLALQVARLVATEAPDRLKHCEGATCTLWFLDRTKARRRLYCSAAGCGNRAKVAAFRERQRGHVEGE